MRITPSLVLAAIACALLLVLFPHAFALLCAILVLLLAATCALDPFLRSRGGSR